MPISKEWAFDRSFLRKTYNREVLEYFRDLNPDDFEDIDVARKAALRACLVLPKASQLSALQKQFNFNYLVRRVQFGQEIYGMPVQEAQELFKFKPQVQLFFRQDSDAVPPGLRAMEGEISFRLMDKTSTNINDAYLKALATKINREFNTSQNDQVWKKGKLKLHYFDSENGLDLRILCLNEFEGIEIIKKTCRIVEATYNDDCLTPINPKKTSVNVPGNQIILGDSVKKSRWRPTGNVRFRHAVVLIHGLRKAKPLVDLTGRYINALV